MRYANFKKLYEENKDKLLMKDINYPLNYKKGKAWVNGQCDIESINFAETILLSTRYVSFGEFYKSLENICNAYVATYSKPKYRNTDFVLIVHEDMYKSNTWVSLLCFKFLENIITDINSDITEVYNGNKKTICLICDDCAYTGVQIENTIRLNRKHLNYGREKEPSVYSKEWLEWDEKEVLTARRYLKTIDPLKFTIDLIIPYISTLAKNRLQEYKYVRLQRGTCIFPTFIEQFDIKTIPEDILNEFKYTFQYHDEISAIYFDHKIADSISTFHKIYTMAPLFNCSYLKNIKVGFIDNCGNNEVIDSKININEIALSFEDSANTYNICPSTYYKNIKYTFNNEHIPRKKMVKDIIEKLN